MKQAIILLNGNAGNNYGRRNAFRIIESVNQEGYETLVVPVGSDSPCDLDDILSRYHKNFDLCAAVGGDGTLHHTVNALLRNDCEQPIVYVPCGTTNDFASSLGIVQNRTNGKVIGDELMELDAGLFNKEYFTYVAAFGALTEVSYTTPQEVKNVLGYTAYTLNSLQQLPNDLSSRIKVKVESKEFTGEGEYMYGSVSNCFSVAGIKSPILEHVSLNDGLFEVVLIKAPNNIAELVEIAGTLVSGAINDSANKHVKMFTTKKVTFAFEDKAVWTLDGEYGGEVTKAVITVKNKKIRLLK